MLNPKISQAIIAALALLCLSPPALIAGVPQTINYQGRLTNDAGEPLDTTVSMEFAIYDDSTGGELKWTELHPLVTVESGTFNIVLGTIIPIDDSVFNQPDRWLGITVGSDPELAPRTHLASVGYSHRISTVDGASGGNISGDLTLNDDLGIGTSGSIGARLYIENYTDRYGMQVYQSSNSHYAARFINGGGVGPGVEIAAGSPGANNLLLWVGNGDFSSSVLRVEGTGKVGINNEYPDEALDIIGNTTITNGAIGLFNGAGYDKATIVVNNNSGAGYMETKGENGSWNVAIVNPAGYPNNGYVAVYDESSVDQAGMFVNDLGNGIVYGDAWVTKKSNPKKDGTEIWYSGLQGPEAAAYIRGTGQLKNGYCVIELPEHYKTTIISEGITVNLTPLSSSSKGLAVTYKGIDRIEVHELHNGSGTYDFDYLVTGIRKGFEDFQVIKPSNDGRPENPESKLFID